MTPRCDGYEIPAYAGMTVQGVGSLLAGNDGSDGGATRPVCGALGTEWIPAYAGMTARGAEVRG